MNNFAKENIWLFSSLYHFNEPAHDKTNKMACEPRED